MKILRRAFRLAAHTASRVKDDMFGPFGIITFFMHQPLRDDVYRAIASHDPQRLDASLRALHPAEVDGRMIEFAIETGDVAIFRQILAVTGPNKPIVHLKYCASYVFPKETYSPLKYALLTRKHDIAMALATDPRTDVPAAFPPDEDPSAQARRAGMPDVAAVLSKRMEGLKRQPAPFPVPKFAK